MVAFKLDPLQMQQQKAHRTRTYCPFFIKFKCECVHDNTYIHQAPLQCKHKYTRDRITRY